VECAVTCTGTGSYKVRNRRKIPLFAVVALDNLRIGCPIAGSHLVCCPSREKVRLLRFWNLTSLDTYKPLEYGNVPLLQRKGCESWKVPFSFEFLDPDRTQKLKNLASNLEEKSMRKPVLCIRTNVLPIRIRLRIRRYMKKTDLQAWQKVPT
jgi:hypothetical protein